ncbi:MAG: 3-hydroxyacyl-ACP dehydratase FabZ [Coriobacteriales bacterium]|nr:3-hydroxyacyl-ACP dehydratase FabZ [Coriobacteriales bacterium]
MQLTITQIQELLPHRYPFLLIDRVIDFKAGEWAHASKCVTVNEPFFTGHFPGNPIMPGVLLLEALAQTGGIALMSAPQNEGKLALFGGVKKARFRVPVVPGDVLDLTCTLTKQRGPLGFGEAEAKVGDTVVCSAELSFAIVDVA